MERIHKTNRGGMKMTSAPSATAVTDGDGALKAEIHKPRITMDRLDVAVADCNHQVRQ
jgi:hypothetical protein